MQLKGEQLASHLEQGLLPIYVLFGDEPLLVLEGADAVRRKARVEGFDEREVMTVLPGFDWGQLMHAASSMSLFGGRKLLDLRIPNGKPGREGGQALLAYADRPSPDSVLLISLPALDWKDEKAAWLLALGKSGAVIKFTAPPIAELPGWIAGRLRRQQQKSGMEGLKFMAERVEGNLLAAHQEIQKLGLLYPPGELSLQQIQDAVLNVARYRIEDLREALLAGDLPRFSRTLIGLRDEGEALPLVIWAVTEEVRALAVIRAGLDRGQALDGLLKLAKIWGPRASLIKGALQRASSARLGMAMQQLGEADQLAKGLQGRAKHLDAWDALLWIAALLIKGANDSETSRVGIW